MTNTLPTSAFDGILAKLADVLEITQRAEGINNPQTRQALLQATKDFKDALLKAKDTANGLPGGELSIADQDRVIEMLEKLRERTRSQLALFTSNMSLATSTSEHEAARMEIDSTASTPYQ